MNDIRIVGQEETDTGWLFQVDLTGDMFSVTVDRRYWQKLTGGEKPEKLVVRSFQFLLEREPKESILTSFDLRVISIYFPEYEQKISVT